MSHKKIFFYEHINGSFITLEGEEAHHALKVLRLKEGDDIKIIDGKGKIASGKIFNTKKDSILIEIKNISLITKPQKRINLIVGISEIKALEDILFHCTQLGVSTYCFVNTKYSSLKVEFLEKRMNRMKKIVIASLKQSGNPFLPEIKIYKSLEEAIKNYKKGFLLSQDAQKYLIDFDFKEDEINLAIGPEGDFSQEEKKLLTDFYYIDAKLSPFTLRVETSAISALSIISEKVYGTSE